MADIRATRDFLRPVLKQPHGALTAGAANPLWDTILEMVVDKVFQYILDQDDGPVRISMDYDKWDVSKVIEISGTGPGQWGMNVFGYPAVVKLPLGSLKNNVPLYLTASKVVNPDGTLGARKKWSEWRPDAPQTDTHAYIELAFNGVAEDGRTMAKLVADSFNVIQVKAARTQMEAYLAAHPPT